MDLLGRRYDVQLVDVSFDGAPTPDPEIDVRISRGTDVAIIVEAQGPASNPQLTFSSQPPVYTEEQVMTMILSGNAGNSDVGDESLDDQVAGALSGTFVGQLTHQLLPGLPLDVIKVEQEKDSYGHEDTRLEVGKYITESLYLSYVHQSSYPVRHQSWISILRRGASA